MTNNSIINIGDVSKPADTLINKISDAIGGLTKPSQIKRLAKAQAEADIIKAEAEIEIEGRKRRALTRFVAEETQKQENIEQITEKAIPLLIESANPQNMDNDWIINFFDKCRIISDQDMQQLWSKILAGEANSPSTYSKRTINLLGSLDKGDCELFSSLCSFSFLIGEAKKRSILVLNKDNAQYDTIYSSKGLSFQSLTYLDDIGLANFNAITGFVLPNQTQVIPIEYFGKSSLLRFKMREDNRLDIGQVQLTESGKQLFRVCEQKYIEGFYDFVIQFWTKQGIKIDP